MGYQNISERNFNQQPRDLRFSDRGYPKSVLKRSYKYALTRNRTNLLETHNDRPTGTTRNDLRTIGQYDNNALEVREIINKY